MLSAFTAAEPRLGLGDLADRVGLPKATVHRLAGSLVALGFMRHGEDGRYSLGLKLSELGALARADLDVVTACSTILDELAATTGESVMLAAVDWETLELTIVSTRISPQTLSVIPMAGQRLTIPPGALGKALLIGLSPAEAESMLGRLPLPALTQKTHDRAQMASDLAAARRDGFAVAEEEYLDGVSGVAVPVIFDAGRPRAAIGVVGPSLRIGGQLEQIGRLMLDGTASLRPMSTLATGAAA